MTWGSSAWGDKPWGWVPAALAVTGAIAASETGADAATAAGKPLPSAPGAGTGWGALWAGEARGTVAGCIWTLNTVNTYST